MMVNGVALVPEVTLILTLLSFQANKNLFPPLNLVWWVADTLVQALDFSLTEKS